MRQSIFFTLLSNPKVPRDVSWLPSMLFFYVTSNSRSFVFIDALVQEPAQISDMICITQITPKHVNSTLLGNEGRFRLLYFKFIFDLTAGEDWTNLGPGAR